MDRSLSKILNMSRTPSNAMFSMNMGISLKSIE